MPTETRRMQSGTVGEKPSGKPGSKAGTAPALLPSAEAEPTPTLKPRRAIFL